MKHSNVKPRSLLKPILAQRPWQIITMDLVGKFCPAQGSGHTHCLVIIDKFSKFVILEPVAETLSADQTAEIFLRRVVSIFGIPSVVITDRGTQFSARLWKQLLEKLGASAALASSHHPQTDGQSERAIQTFLRLMRSYTYELNEQWEQMLPLFQYALNGSAVKPNAVSPHRLVFGHHPISPLQSLCKSMMNDEENDVNEHEWVTQKSTTIEHLWKFVRENQERCAERIKSHYDKNRKELSLEPGDLVLVSAKSHPQLRPYRKQSEKWYGPYVVKRKVNDNAYAIAELPPGTPETQNVGYLSKYRESPSRFPNRPPIHVNIPELKDGEWEWEVDYISDAKTDRRGKMKFLVHWVGYPQPQWTEISELENAKESISDYYEKTAVEIPQVVTRFSDDTKEE